MDTKFKNRYPLESSIDLTNSKINSARQNYLEISRKNINRMREVKNRPENLKYFESALLDQTGRIKELTKFKSAGGKIVGIFCVHVPEELVYAAGAVPIRLECGFYDAIAPAEEVVPKNTCPLIKASIGFNFLKINQIFQLCDAVIIPTTCDGKKKMADILSNFMEVWTLELPNDKENPATSDLWGKQVYGLKKKLEGLTGRIVTKKALKEQIKRLHLRTALIRELLDLRTRKELSITGRDMYLVLQVAFFDDIDRWTANLHRLVEEVAKSKNEVMDSKIPRVILTGSPLIWPNMKLLHLIEESGGIVIADDSCACSQYFYDPAELDEWSMKSMMDSISDKSLLPKVCPIFVHSDDRVDKLFELVEKYRADGIVYHVLRLCQVFDYEFMKISKAFEKKKIPLIKIETEYSEEDTGQIKTRIEAFIEMMEARK